MATIDFSAQPVANPASPPTGWSQPAWSDNARVDGAPSFSWFLASGGESQWFFDTILPTGGYSETTSYSVNITSRGPILADSSGNGYGLLCNSTNIRIYLYTAGSLTGGALHIVAQAAAPGSVYRLQYNGSGNFVILEDGVDITGLGGFNDTTHTGPFYGGLFSRDGGAGISDVTVDAVASTSIAQTDATPEDGAQQTVTCTGMTGPITAATLGGVDILSELSGTDPSVSITYTYDISAQAIETNQPQPRIGIPVDLIFTTVADGAVSTSVTIGPKTGWALTELDDPINTDTAGLVDTIQSAESITITNADAFYYDTSNNASISNVGVYSSDLTSAGEFSKVLLQVGGTSPSTTYADNFYPYGDGGGSVKKLTSSKLTGVKLTSNKLTASKL